MAAKPARACPHCAAADSTHQSAGLVIQNFYLTCPCHGGQVSPAPPPRKSGLARRLAPFGASVLVNVIAGLIVAAVVALYGFLVAHWLHPGHPAVHQSKTAITTAGRRQAATPAPAGASPAGQSSYRRPSS